MASALEQAAESWLATLDRRERATMRTLSAHYAASQRSMAASLAHALRRQRVLERQGRGVSYRYARGRLEQLRRLVDAELADLNTRAARTISAGARAAADEAIAWSRGFIAEQMPPGFGYDIADLRRRTVETSVALQSRGGPVADLLAEFAQGDRVGKALTTGIATGANPLVVARRISADVTATYRGRAQLIARTEMMRSVRHASRESMRADRDVLNGWVWWSSLDRTTCAACWGMHGTEHPVDDLLDGHPGCRCSAVPIVRPLPGITPPDLGDTGEAIFRRLPEDQQLAILGPGRFALYRDGQATLADMVTRQPSERWGPMRRVTTVRDLRRRAGLSPDGPPAPPRTPSTPAPTPAPTKAAAPSRHPDGWPDDLNLPDGFELPDDLAAPPEWVKPSSLLDNRFEKARNIAAEKRSSAMIDKVLRLPADARGLPLVDNKRLGSGVRGEFSRYRAENTPNQIRMAKSSPKGHKVEQTVNTLNHEIGHWIDWSIITDRGAANPASQAAPELAAFREAIRASRAYGEIQEKGARLYGWSHTEYLLRGRELWARAFSQWIAIRSGDAPAIAAHRAAAGLEGAQWADDDFGPIAEAMDNLFRRFGWMR